MIDNNTSGQKDYKQLFNDSLNSFEQLRDKNILLSKNLHFSNIELNTLVKCALDFKNIYALSYCLSIETDNNLILEKESLFLIACKNGFIQGMEMLSTQLDLNHTYKTTDLEQSLLHQGMLSTIINDNPKNGLRFLIHNGADVHFNNDYLFKYALNNNYMTGVEHLIKEHNVSDIIIHDCFNDTTINQQSLLKKWVKQREDNLAENVFIMPVIAEHLTRRKI